MNSSGSGVGEDPLAMDDDEDAFFNDSYSRQLEDMAQGARASRAASPGWTRSREVLMGHSRGGGMAVISAAEAGTGGARDLGGHRRRGPLR